MWTTKHVPDIIPSIHNFFNPVMILKFGNSPVKFEFFFSVFFELRILRLDMCHVSDHLSDVKIS